MVATTQVDNKHRRKKGTARVLFVANEKLRWFFSSYAPRFFGLRGFSVGSPLLYIDTKNKKRPRFFFAETKQRHRQPTSPLARKSNPAKYRRHLAATDRRHLAHTGRTHAARQLLLAPARAAVFLFVGSSVSLSVGWFRPCLSLCLCISLCVCILPFCPKFH